MSPTAVELANGEPQNQWRAGENRRVTSGVAVWCGETNVMAGTGYQYMFAAMGGGV